MPDSACASLGCGRWRRKCREEVARLGSGGDRSMKLSAPQCPMCEKGRGQNSLFGVTVSTERAHTCRVLRTPGTGEKPSMFRIHSHPLIGGPGDTGKIHGQVIHTQGLSRLTGEVQAEELQHPFLCTIEISHLCPFANLCIMVPLVQSSSICPLCFPKTFFQYH